MILDNATFCAIKHKGRDNCQLWEYSKEILVMVEITQSFKIEVEAIDADHRRLVDIINEITLAIERHANVSG